jgi:hypothetical protein
MMAAAVLRVHPSFGGRGPGLSVAPPTRCASGAFSASASTVVQGEVVIMPAPSDRGVTAPKPWRRAAPPRFSARAAARAPDRRDEQRCGHRLMPAPSRRSRRGSRNTAAARRWSSLKVIRRGLCSCGQDYGRPVSLGCRAAVGLVSCVLCPDADSGGPIWVDCLGRPGEALPGWKQVDRRRTQAA